MKNTLNKRLLINTVKDWNDTESKQLLSKKVISACSRLVTSRKVKDYLNRSDYKFIGELGKFYSDDDYRIIKETTRIKRKTLPNGRICWKRTDNQYSANNADGYKYKLVGKELYHGELYSIMERVEERVVFNHRSGDLVLKTNQLFFKVPIVRVNLNGKMKVISNDRVSIINVLSKIDPIELYAWMNCDVDYSSVDNESPYFTYDELEGLPELFIDLCSYLNDKLGMRITINNYK